MTETELNNPQPEDEKQDIPCECNDCEQENKDKTNVLSTLGNGLSFGDVEHLRTTLHKLEVDEYEKDMKITSLQDEYNRQKEEIRYEVDQLIIPRKKDKEAMKEAGFTRQDEYEQHLRRNDLAEPIYEIEQKIIPIAESLEKARKEKRDADLTIRDLKRKLDIRLKYAPLMFQTIRVPMNIIDETEGK